MNDINKKEFLLKMIVTLFESKAKTYTDMTINIWVEQLQVLSFQELQTAFKKAIDSPDDFPTVGKIKKLCHPDYEIEAEKTYNYIRDCIRQGQEYKIDKDIKKLVPGGVTQMGLIDNDFKRREHKKEFMNKFVDKFKKESLMIAENKKILEG